MMRQKYFITVMILFVTGWCLNCTMTGRVEKPEDRRTRVSELVNRIRANPSDWEALQELGVILVKSHLYERGKILLERSLRVNPRDPKTVFYYGLCHEFCNDDRRAFNVYRNYSKFSSASQYRRMMRARYDFLTRKLMREEAKALLGQEGQLATKTILPNAIAVFPFMYQGSDSNYISLGKGVSEMMITDLSQVKQLTLIERIRMQAMMEEMKLEQTGLVDSKTAPRFGRLLSAGQIVYGSYDILDEERFTVDVELLDLLKSQSPPLSAKSTEMLNNLFTTEKRLVFGIIAKMGIELTPLERERIMRVPTRNMQAFMAYCTGLEQQDAGHYGEAAASFQRAATLDPGFEMAGEKAQESEATAETGTDKETVLSSLDRVESRIESSPTTDNLVGDRLQNVMTNLDSNFVPGQDDRKATGEATTSGADVGLGNLPDPPRPPVRR
ncbi:MAG: CsgG/HfaB family protein [bacterium]